MKIFSRLFAPATAAVLAATLTACAGFDPNNVISRSEGWENLSVPVSNSSGGPLTPDVRQAAFDFVWTTIGDHYYDPKLNGVDWRAQRTRYLPEALEAGDDEAFWDVLDRLAGELRDSHTRVESPRRAEARKRFENQSLGLGLIWDGPALVVSSVNPNSDAWWAGVRPGMALRRIGSEDAPLAFKRILDATRDGSTPRARHLSAVGKLNRGDTDAPVAMTFLRADGSELAAVLKRRTLSTPPMVQSRILPSGFAYVRFSNFLPSLADQVNAALLAGHTAPGLIVDLRNNGGGSLTMAKDLLDAFFKEKVPMSRQITRNGKPITVAWGALEVVKMEYDTMGRADAYAGPVVILVNAGSASGSELFAAAMQDLGRAAVIGEPSCGCLLGYIGYAKVPGGGELAYSEIGFRTPNGRRIEGDGVIPDVAVPATAADLQVGRDRALETAQQWLAAKAATH